ncbi:hypothetical protein [Azoarcus sp. DN11]|uniref:hypothetical protein n=1 Tax=Azoarcus sp. DN11 TaxID=356837 RepID=UPI000EAE2ED9|nr:hypothetical protein [Azoarcus sp. DN11]AYH44033.1 hypothetical protein CDA09_11660 [Azoarcus sp. DN11]
MRTPFGLRQRNYYPWLFIGLAVAANAAAFSLLPTRLSPELFLSVTGAVAALVHFLYSQHNHNTERFISLFRDFNAHYDRLNNRLNALLLRDGSLLLTIEDKQLLYDYFNLCAEEYLYFKSGYIDTEVWQSWLRGMKYFASNTEIRRLWCEELESGSYYGFSLALFDAAP